MTNYRDRITIEAGKRGGQPCVRGTRITVYDVLGWLATGMTEVEILRDYPELESQDVRACLAYAADREHRLLIRQRETVAAFLDADGKACIEFF